MATEHLARDSWAKIRKRIMVLDPEDVVDVLGGFVPYMEKKPLTLVAEPMGRGACPLYLVVFEHTCEC